MAGSRASVLIGLVLLVAAGCGHADAWVELGGECFRVELAETLEAKARGLMFREELADKRGMLFVYDTESERRFWMKNTLIPLDILFFDGERRLINWHTAEPCRADPCPGYPGAAPARYVLELNAGTAEELGLEPGDRLVIHPAR